MLKAASTINEEGYKAGVVLQNEILQRLFICRKHNG